MNPVFVQKYISFINSYRSSNLNIYFFMKDCLFTRLYKSNNNQFPSAELQNQFNFFQQEMRNANFQRSSINKEMYQRFLNDFLNKMNFKTADLGLLEIIKVMTENLGIFGAFDDLTQRQLSFLNKRMNELKEASSKQNQGGSIGNGTKYNSADLGNKNSINKGNNFNLPDASEGSISNSEQGINKKMREQEEMRLNEIMRKRKLNMPIDITNFQPGQFYNPLTCPNHIPKGIDNSLPLPIRKNDPNYGRVRQKIEEELALANQELDYHKIDHARNHLEIAAFYLKNVIE